MTDLIGLAHIGIFTEDIEKSKDFYINILGFNLDFETTIDKGEGAYLKVAFVKIGSLIIELLQPSESARIKTGNDGAADHIAIEVKNIDQCITEFKQKGIVFESEKPVYIEKLYNSVKVVFFRGPSKERLELFEYINR